MSWKDKEAILRTLEWPLIKLYRAMDEEWRDTARFHCRYAKTKEERDRAIRSVYHGFYLAKLELEEADDDSWIDQKIDEERMRD